MHVHRLILDGPRVKGIEVTRRAEKENIVDPHRESEVFDLVGRGRYKGSIILANKIFERGEGIRVKRSGDVELDDDPLGKLRCGAESCTRSF